MYGYMSVGVCACMHHVHMRLCMLCVCMCMCVEVRGQPPVSFFRLSSIPCLRQDLSLVRNFVKYNRLASQRASRNAPVFISDLAIHGITVLAFSPDFLGGF